MRFSFTLSQLDAAARADTAFWVTYDQLRRAMGLTPGTHLASESAVLLLDCDSLAFDEHKLGEGQQRAVRSLAAETDMDFFKAAADIRQKNIDLKVKLLLVHDGGGAKSFKLCKEALKAYKQALDAFPY